MCAGVAYVKENALALSGDSICSIFAAFGITRPGIEPTVFHSPTLYTSVFFASISSSRHSKNHQSKLNITHWSFTACLAAATLCHADTSPRGDVSSPRRSQNKRRGLLLCGVSGCAGMCATVSQCPSLTALSAQMEFIDVGQLSFIHDLGPKGL